MGLDVGELHVLFLGDGGEPLQLFNDQCVNVARVPWLLASAKLFAIGKSGMGTGGYIESSTQAQGGSHAGFITSVCPAGNVCRTDKGHDRRIVAAAFTKVAVEIDAAIHG